MPKIPRHLSLSARKKAPVNLLMCTFELYMFIGVSMQLRELCEVSSDPILLVSCTKKKSFVCSLERDESGGVSCSDT